MSRPLVDVCVLVYNQPDITLDFFRHITKVTPPGLVRFWVLDNGSTDPGVDRAFRWLKRNCSKWGFGVFRGFPAKFFKADTNMHFSGGNNFLSKLGDAPWLCFINNDAFPPKGWLSDLVEAANANGWGAVGPISNRVIGIQSIKFNHSLMDLPQQHETKMLSGFCMLVRRKHFEYIGGWDEQFDNGDEDLDLSVRLRMEVPCTLGVARNVYVEHVCSASLEPWAAAQGKSLQEHFAGTRKLLLDKHGERVQNDLWFWESLTAPKDQWSKMGVLPNGYYFYPPGRGKDQARAISTGESGVLPADELRSWTPQGPTEEGVPASKLHPWTSEDPRANFRYHVGTCEGGGLVVQVVERGGRCRIYDDNRPDGRRYFCATCEKDMEEKINRELVDGLHVQQHTRSDLRPYGGNGRLN